MPQSARSRGVTEVAWAPHFGRLSGLLDFLKAVVSLRAANGSNGVVGTPCYGQKLEVGDRFPHEQAQIAQNMLGRSLRAQRIASLSIILFLKQILAYFPSGDSAWHSLPPNYSIKIDLKATALWVDRKNRKTGRLTASP